MCDANFHGGWKEERYVNTHMMRVARDCSIKSASMERLFRSSRDNMRPFLEHELNTQVDASLRGSVDWEID